MDAGIERTPLMLFVDSALDSSSGDNEQPSVSLCPDGCVSKAAKTPDVLACNGPELLAKAPELLLLAGRVDLVREMRKPCIRGPPVAETLPEDCTCMEQCEITRIPTSLFDDSIH
jgi:hypothetical protein